MAIHSHVKVWVHLIWDTHKRERMLHRDLRLTLFDHLVNQSEELEIVIEKLNIQPEHVHMLFPLPSDVALARVVKSLKGESSSWINENSLVKGKFSWQRGYGSYSVSASQLERVKRYIRNQDVHHRRHTFQEEYEDWAKRYGVFDEG